MIFDIGRFKWTYRISKKYIFVGYSETAIVFGFFDAFCWRLASRRHAGLGMGDFGQKPSI